METIARVMVFVFGLGIVLTTLLSAVKTFILPRSAPDFITRIVFLVSHRVFSFRLRWADTYAKRDSMMALFAPVSLLMLLPIWYITIFTGYICMYWAIGSTFYKAFLMSGSSLFTLGFSSVEDLFPSLLIFSEAALGFLLVALLIAYLPTMYSAFSRREVAVTLMEVRAGQPPSAVEMLKRFHRIHGLRQLNEQWRMWEAWFADIEESHTSLPALVFFRSPRPDHSWVNAAGVVLDAASLTLAAVNVPDDPQAALCIRAGFIALRRISDYFDVPYYPNPQPDDPISVTRAEFDAALEELAASGVPLKKDRAQAWRDFNGWRVNYDTVLLAMAGMTMAPAAPWSSDRAIDHRIHFRIQNRKSGK
jgi:hypothetical protein